MSHTHLYCHILEVILSWLGEDVALKIYRQLMSKFRLREITERQMGRYGLKSGGASARVRGKGKGWLSLRALEGTGCQEGP